MQTNPAVIDRFLAQLDEELTACHAAVLEVMDIAPARGFAGRLSALKGATDLIRAQMSAATLLLRLKRDLLADAADRRNAKTNAWAADGVPPTREKSKTNNPAESLENANAASQP